ncbi:hypothetical protein ACFSDA_07580 [Brachybacterium rhamnosum]|uniref:Alpha/beta hydrolase n=1 Tax=Brachybacterium rhamnosum TaxID=173361 RepID=A0ABW4PZP0_9MICO
MFTQPVTRWADTREFLAATSHEDGLHVLGDGAGRQTEMFLGGHPFEVESSDVLVIFSGAVTNRRAKVPPFFSGSGLAAATGHPFIALSDPALELSESLAIGWYAGSVHHDTQREIIDLLTPLSQRLGKRLWTVGGSAGGFAALWFGHALPGAPSVFAWNPQTDLLEYSPSFVRQYLDAAMPEAVSAQGARSLQKVGREAFRNAGHSHSVLEFLPTQSPSRLLYLQNSTDEHLVEHCAPYLEAHGYARYGRGLWRRDREHVVWIADVADGHLSPTRDQLIDVLSRITREDGDLLGLVQDLDLADYFGDLKQRRPDPLRKFVAGR